MSAETSRLRRQLLDTEHELHRQLEFILAHEGPLIRGSLGTRARVCGKPGCRCTRGELHESKYIAASDGGQMRQVHVPAADELRVADGVERYRRFREARSRLADDLASLTRRQLELVDALGRSLLEPYPPDNPLPPPKRRGRSKGGRGVSR
jgi:hypothetical protein